MKLFVDLWTDPILVDFADTHWLLKEQDLLLHLIFDHPYLRNRIGWVHQSLFNGYATEQDGVAWQPGDLAIHFPDCAYVFLLCNNC
jgi:hypothetical protein